MFIPGFGSISALNGKIEKTYRRINRKVLRHLGKRQKNKAYIKLPFRLII